MARKKRAWNMSNPLYRYLHKGKSAKTRKVKRGVGMARRGRRGGSRGGFGGGNFVTDLLAGMGAAAATKRFVGQPLGSFTGLAAGAGTAMVFKKNMVAYAAGGFIHDNIGNSVGIGTSSSSQVLY